MGCCRQQATIYHSSTLPRLFCTLICALSLCPPPLLSTCTSTTTRHYHRHYHQYVERPRRPTLVQISSCSFTPSVGNLLVITSSQRRDDGNKSVGICCMHLTLTLIDCFIIFSLRLVWFVFADAFLK